MSHAILFTLSVGLNVLLGIAAHQFWLWGRRISQENKIMSDMIFKIIEEEQKRMDDAREFNFKYTEERNRAIMEEAKVAYHEVAVDHQTFLLIHLAANNPNVNEAAVAAMQVCMRLAKPRTLQLKARS